MFWNKKKLSERVYSVDDWDDNYITTLECMRTISPHEMKEVAIQKINGCEYVYSLEGELLSLEGHALPWRFTDKHPTKTVGMLKLPDFLNRIKLLRGDPDAIYKGVKVLRKPCLEEIQGLFYGACGILSIQTSNYFRSLDGLKCTLQHNTTLEIARCQYWCRKILNNPKEFGYE